MPIPFLVYAGIAIAGSIQTYFESKSNKQEAEKIQSAALERYHSARDALQSKQRNTNKSLVETQQYITNAYETLLARYNPIMERYERAVLRMRVIPKPPGFKVVEEYQAKPITFDRISTPEIKELVISGLGLGAMTLGHLAAIKYGLAGSMGHPSMVSRGLHAFHREGLHAKTTAMETEKQVDEYCLEASHAMEMLDKAAQLGKNAKDNFDQHIVFFNRYIEPCEKYVAAGIKALTPDQLGKVACLYTIGTSLHQKMSEAVLDV